MSMWKKLLYNFLLALLPLLCGYADEVENPNQCVNSNWQTVEYQHTGRGEVKIFVTPVDYNITATNLACMIAIEVLNRAKDMPVKMTLGLISEDYRRAFIAQWSFIDDRFAIIEATIPEAEYRTLGIFTIYPEPLSRIREIMVVKRMPTKDELPPHLQYKFKTNFVPTSVMQLRSLVEQTKEGYY